VLVSPAQLLYLVAPAMKLVVPSKFAVVMQSPVLEVKYPF
jgi:hypothetical protein